MVRHHLQSSRTANGTSQSTRTTGQGHRPRRTSPNWFSAKATGQEYNAWGVPKNPPEHEANLFFTRMTSGPMDFTPGVISLKGTGNTDIPSTVAKQLAQYVVLYSPVQMAADLQENYEANPAAFAFIKQGVRWEDTRSARRRSRRLVVVARKQRRGSDWYLGAVTTNRPATSRSIVPRSAAPTPRPSTATGPPRVRRGRQGHGGRAAPCYQGDTRTSPRGRWRAAIRIATRP